MKWIDCEKRKPKGPFEIVFVTDGKIICLARWIEKPLDWYEPEFFILNEEWKEPHWEFQTDIGPFLGNDECFGIIEDISH